MSQSIVKHDDTYLDDRDEFDLETKQCKKRQRIETMSIRVL